MEDGTIIGEPAKVVQIISDHLKKQFAGKPPEIIPIVADADNTAVKVS